MKKSIWIASLCSVAVASAFVGSLAVADDAKQTPPAMQLPPGWTMEDVQACTIAGTPGEQHKHLTQDVGVWEGKSSMVMAPGMPPVESTNKMTVTSMMDGRYVKITSEGEMPGMGMFKGEGIYGYDNVSQKFVAVWFDNMGTGLMNGTGELSADGKVLTTHYNFNCPITKKPAVMREVETTTGPGKKTLEMFTNDPKTGVEYKMMTIEYVKKS